MRVLVTGAWGFIGSHIVTALLAAGHTPVCAVRAGRGDARFPELARVDCDFARDDSPDSWRPRLQGIDAVVNCAGILREQARDSHRLVNEATPVALFRACADAGVRRVVQISALGDADVGAFIAAKHRADEALLAMDLDAVVLRPSLVYSTGGSWGGSSLLRALAAAPLIPLPGDGRQPVQPLAAQDLANAVVAALARNPPIRDSVELVGPETMSLRDWLARWREWLGLGRARFLPLPKWLAGASAWLGERLGSGPAGLTVLRLLERGRTVDDNDNRQRWQQMGVTPRNLASALAARPASSADHWHARLYPLMPLLRMVLALTWIAAGVVGLALEREVMASVLAPAGLSADTTVLFGQAASVIDIVLGVLLLLRVQVKPVLALMALSVVAYTIFIGIWLPHWWLDPFGGLIKNFVILVALAIAAATAGRS